MKIWEAIIYAIVGGVAEILPISFSGHSLLLQSMFHLSPLYSNDGPFVRAAVSIGIFIALYMIYNGENQVSKELRGSPGSVDPRYRRHRREAQALQSRIFLLAIIGMIPTLFSFIFLGKAESMGNLMLVAALFVANGIMILLCTRGPVGTREAGDTYLYDTFFMGLFRMICVFPGLSPVGASLSIGRARGLTPENNFRFTYFIALGFQGLSAVYYLLRGLFVGSFYGRTILSMLIAMILSAVVSFLTVLTFRNMIRKDKLRSFLYYSIDAAAIAFIIAIING